MKRRIIVIVLWVSAAVCLGQQQLADDADEAQFRRQLFGEWVKCAPHSPHRGVTNGVLLVEAICFKPNGSADWKETAGPKTGRYLVEFERPPARGAVTYTRIILTATNGHRDTLTRVNIGEDNRFPQGERFLRMEGPAVYQVFRKKNSQPDGPANRSQPSSPDSNRSSVAAGSDR